MDKSTQTLDHGQAIATMPFAAWGLNPRTSNKLALVGIVYRVVRGHGDKNPMYRPPMKRGMLVKVKDVTNTLRGARLVAYIRA